MSIIAVSDVHLGMKGAKEKEFIDFLESLKESGKFEMVSDFVLLGDIIDIWRRDFTKAVIECSESLLLLNGLVGNTRVHYIAGNHDYYMLRLFELHGENFPFKVKKSTVINNGSQEFFFFHGYQLEVLCNPHYKSMKTYETFSENMCLAGDDEGNAADAVYKLFQSCSAILNDLKRLPENPYAAFKSMMEPPETRIRNVHGHNVIKPIKELAKAETRHFLFGIRPEQFLVYGHTHDPYVYTDGMVANTGSWGFGEKGECNYLEIDNGSPVLKEFK